MEIFFSMFNKHFQLETSFFMFTFFVKLISISDNSQNPPQCDQCVEDVSVAVPFDIAVEHIESSEETRQLLLLMDLARASSSERVVQVQSTDCMDY